MESIEKLRELAADINSTEIIDHISVYPCCKLRGDWLDSWHSEFDRLCDEIEREISEHYAPIVRCRDCKHYDKSDAGCSYFVLAKNKLLHIGNPDGFCAWGERRSE
jgi:hypothetical protein